MTTLRPARTHRFALAFAALTPALALAQSPAATQPTTPPATAAQPADQPKAGQVDLRSKFKAGQQIRYSFDQTANNKIKSASDAGDNGAETTDSKQTQHIGLLMKVLESNAEGATIQVVYESVKVTLDGPDGKSEFDSTKPRPAPKTKPSPASQQPKPGAPGSKAPQEPPPPANPLQQMADLDMNGLLEMLMRPAVGATVTVKTDSKGAITSVTGGESIGGPLSIGGGGGLPMPSQMANWLVAGLSGAGPAKDGFAKVGDTWSNSDSLTGTPVGAFTMTTKHTLRSAFGGTANVAFSGGIEPKTEASAPGASAGQVQSANYSGTYAWDTRAGNLAEMSTDMRVVLDGGLTAMPMRMSSQTQVHIRREGAFSSR